MRFPRDRLTTALYSEAHKTRTLPDLYSKRLERLYEKSSNSGEPPRHEANHASVHQRFPARTKPLVVFAHPPLLIDPGDRPLHHPPPRQHHEAFGGHEFLSI